MRVIGHLPTETTAGIFSDHLLVEGIHNSVEQERDGWAIWIHSEDEIPKARALLEAFNIDPADARFHRSRGRAAEIKEQEQAEEQKASKRVFDRSKIFKSTTPYGVGPLTLILILACAAIALITGTNPNHGIYHLLRITDTFGTGSFARPDLGLPEVFHGQVWRLFGPALLHGGLLHLFFNMWWLFDLGSMIEGRESSWRLLALVLVIAAISNFAQFYFRGPAFGGMSGVVYGLLGYIWVKGKFDPASGLYLHPQTVAMMLIWFFLCAFDFFPGVANWAHGAGLVCGMAWGFLSSMYQNRRRV